MHVSICLWCGSDPSLNLTGNVPRPRAGDLRASMRADQEGGGGSVWVNQCSSMPVKQAPAIHHDGCAESPIGRKSTP